MSGGNFANAFSPFFACATEIAVAGFPKGRIVEESSLPAPFVEALADLQVCTAVQRVGCLKDISRIAECHGRPSRRNNRKTTAMAIVVTAIRIAILRAGADTGRVGNGIDEPGAVRLPAMR
jgi:hypothetical protein